MLTARIFFSFPLLYSLFRQFPLKLSVLHPRQVRENGSSADWMNADDISRGQARKPETWLRWKQTEIAEKGQRGLQNPFCLHKQNCTKEASTVGLGGVFCNKHWLHLPAHLSFQWSPTWFSSPALGPQTLIALTLPPWPAHINVVDTLCLAINKIESHSLSKSLTLGI